MVPILNSGRLIIRMPRVSPTSVQVVLAPTYDIDLIWHTHQLRPQRYCADTVGLLGFVYAHDDSMQDRSAGSSLNNAHDEVRKRWSLQYNDEFNTPGGMFRGEPPSRLSAALHDPNALLALFSDAVLHGTKFQISSITCTMQNPMSSLLIQYGHDTGPLPRD